MKYEDYLKSDHWRGTKLLLEVKYGKYCKICYSTENVQCHHMRYRRRHHEVKLFDLRWLCKRCHSLAHAVEKRGELKLKSGMHPEKRFFLTKRAVMRAIGNIEYKKMRRTREMAEMDDFGLYPYYPTIILGRKKKTPIE